MKSVFFFMVAMIVAGNALATETGNLPPIAKGHFQVRMNPVTDGREGGETIDDAVPIPSLPFSDTGATCDNVDDYDETCPWFGPSSPDVVYAYTPAADQAIDIDLCGSGYDTKLYVYAGGHTPDDPFACNDDYYLGGICGFFASFLTNVMLTGGTTYYIVIDGYEGDCGDYDLEVREYVSCELSCPEGGIPEGEPALADGYVDEYNGGCNSTPPVFQRLHPEEQSDCITVCCHSGWYQFDVTEYRDTDWFWIRAEASQIDWTITSEYALEMQVLLTDCDQLGEEPSDLAYPCTETTLSFPATPGQGYWLWVGPLAFDGPVNDFDYVMTVCGVTLTPSEKVTWGGLKEMYR